MRIEKGEDGEDGGITYPIRRCESSLATLFVP